MAAAPARAPLARETSGAVPGLAAMVGAVVTNLAVCGGQCECSRMMMDGEVQCGSWMPLGGWRHLMKCGWHRVVVVSQHEINLGVGQLVVDATRMKSWDWSAAVAVSNIIATTARGI